MQNGEQQDEVCVKLIKILPDTHQVIQRVFGNSNLSNPRASKCLKLFKITGTWWKMIPVNQQN